MEVILLSSWLASLWMFIYIRFFTDNYDVYESNFYVLLLLFFALLIGFEYG